MARIPQYEDVPSADTLRFHQPEAVPSDFGGDAGVLLGEAEHRVGQELYNTAQQTEASHVMVQAAQKRSQWSTELERRINSPAGSDPNFAEKFSDDMQNDLAKWRDQTHVFTAGGLRALNENVAELTSHLDQKAGVYVAQKAGVIAQDNFKGYVQTNGSTLVTDPTQFPSIMRQSNLAFNDPQGPFASLPADKRVELQQYSQREYAKAAAIGDIRSDPYAAQDALNNGKYAQYLKPEDVTSLLYRADMGIRGREAEQRRQDALDLKAQSAASEAAENNVIKDIFSDNPKMTANDIANNDALKPAQKLTMLAVQARSVKPDPMAEVSQATTMRLFPLITLPDSDPRKMVDNTAINKEFAAGNLSKPDYNWLQTLITQAKTPDGDSLVKRQTDFLRDYGAQIDKSSLMNIDGESKSRFYNYSYYVNQMVQQYRHDGKNPYDLFDPSKPDFLGKPDIVQSFQAPLDRQAENLANRLRASTAAGAVPQRLPGETIDAWRARTAAQGAK